MWLKINLNRFLWLKILHHIIKQIENDPKEIHLFFGIFLTEVIHVLYCSSNIKASAKVMKFFRDRIFICIPQIVQKKGSIIIVGIIWSFLYLDMPLIFLKFANSLRKIFFSTLFHVDVLEYVCFMLKEIYFDNYIIFDNNEKFQETIVTNKILNANNVAASVLHDIYGIFLEMDHFNKDVHMNKSGILRKYNYMNIIQAIY